jgi:hypothetical protein
MLEQPGDKTLNYLEEEKRLIPMIACQELSPGSHHSQEVMK